MHVLFETLIKLFFSPIIPRVFISTFGAFTWQDHITLKHIPGSDMQYRVEKKFNDIETENECSFNIKPI